MTRNEIVFPHVEVLGQPQHVMCTADDAVEFLAAASAWLKLKEVATSVATEEEAWAVAQETHNQARFSLASQEQRQQLLAQLESDLFKHPAYSRWWGQLIQQPHSFRSH